MLKKDLLKILKDHRGPVIVELATEHCPYYFPTSKSEVRRQVETYAAGDETCMKATYLALGNGNYDRDNLYIEREYDV